MTATAPWVIYGRGSGARWVAAPPAPLTTASPLRAAREAQGRSLTETARAARIDPATLSRIERGMRLPSAATLGRLAAVLELPELRNHPCRSNDGRSTNVPHFPRPKNAPRCYNVSALEEMLGTDDRDALAVQLKVSTRTIDRLRAKGALTEAEADVYAVRAGFHPGTVWPSWWEFSGE